MNHVKTLAGMLKTAWPWFALAICMTIGGTIELLALVFWFSAYIYTVGFMWGKEGSPYKDMTKTMATFVLVLMVVLWPIQWTDENE